LLKHYKQLTRAKSHRTSNYDNYGDMCFAAAGPKLWNNLPAELRQADISFQRFKWLLKTFFVRVPRSRCIVT